MHIFAWIEWRRKWIMWFVSFKIFVFYVVSSVKKVLACEFVYLVCWWSYCFSLRNNHYIFWSLVDISQLYCIIFHVIFVTCIMCSSFAMTNLLLLFCWLVFVFEERKIEDALIFLWLMYYNPNKKCSFLILLCSRYLNHWKWNKISPHLNFVWHVNMTFSF